MTAKQIEKQSKDDWGPGNKDNVVMRTAAFGEAAKELNELEICARRNDSLTQSNTTVQGLGDDFVVPLGLIAALRMQMKAEGRYENSCSVFQEMFERWARRRESGD